MAKVDWASVSDEALMAAAADDNLAAFEELVKRHQNRVFRMAYHMLSAEGDALDVSQEIFIKIYHARQSYTDNAKFTTWMYRIAHNAIIDRLRQIKRESHVQSGEEVFGEPISPCRNAHQDLALAEVKDKMRLALAALSERQRSMVLMKYYEGFSLKEIADVFECATGTVKATLFQAVRNLRQHLANMGVIGSEVLQ